MKGVVVYNSKYGNCEQVARAIFEGIKETGAEVTIVEAGSAGDSVSGADFIVLGSPTRGGKPTKVVKKFLTALGPVAPGEMRFAAFGTGIAGGIAKGGKISADSIHETLANLGMKPLADPLRASVKGLKGPILDGELDKARQYGRDIGAEAVGAGLPT